MFKLSIVKLCITSVLFMGMSIFSLNSLADTNLQPVKMQSVEINGFWKERKIHDLVSQNNKDRKSMKGMIN